MDKSKRDLVIAIGLVGTFLVLAGRGFLPKNGASAPGSSAAVAVPSDLSFLVAARRNQKAIGAQESIWAREWGRDPFLPQGAEVSTSGNANLTLSGIVWDDRTPLAMVNEKVLKVGDVIEGYRIIEIRPSSIVLWSPAGKTVELELFQSL